jgi:hypothetical protein
MVTNRVGGKGGKDSAEITCKVGSKLLRSLVGRELHD